MEAKQLLDFTAGVIKKYRDLQWAMQAQDIEQMFASLPGYKREELRQRFSLHRSPAPFFERLTDEEIQALSKWLLPQSITEELTTPTKPVEHG